MKFGLIGLGYWGHNYLRLVSSWPGVDLVAVCDASPELVEVARAAVPAALATTDPDELLAHPDLDAVVIATPASTHFRLARNALLRNKHVLCEKPLTMAVDECEELLEVADTVSATLFVGHTFVYNAGVRAARDFVLAEEMGSALYAHGTWNAPGPVRHDVNALWDLAPHPISILSFVLRRQPTTVAATGQEILSAAHEDVVSLHLAYGDDASADIHLSWLAPRKVRSLTITGARRIALFDDLEPTDKLQIFDTASVTRNGAASGGPAKRKLQLPHEPLHVPVIELREPLAAQFDHFLECCRRGLTPESDGRAGTNVVRVLAAAEASLQRGGVPVDVDVAAPARAL